MRFPWPAHLDHDDLFVQRYVWLMERALQLTAGDRTAAEDLLHDAYVQFTLARPDLDAIGSLDAYLYTILRNLRLSQARRAVRLQTGDDRLLDYESIALWRHAQDRYPDRIREDLQGIATYACLRKDTSKAANVLILRFFYGYFPSEIQRVLRTSRRAVDEWLRLARLEAGKYLESPRSLSFLRSRPRPLAVALSGNESIEGLVAAIRTAIQAHRAGECPSCDDWRGTYKEDDGSTLTCASLSHVVSCAVCLDAVNEILRLPRLSERDPLEGPPDRGKTPGGSGGSNPLDGSGGSGSALTRRRSRLARDTFEHRPKALQIAVNGFVVSVHEITSPTSQHTLRVSLDEPLGFVEVFSDQHARLLLLNVEAPPAGPVQQATRVGLSDGRALAITVTFSNHWPEIAWRYDDPVLAESLPGVAWSDEGTPATAVATPDPVGGTTSVSSFSHWMRWIRFEWRPRPSRRAAVICLAAAIVLLLVMGLAPQTAVAAARAVKDAATAVLNWIAPRRSVAPPTTGPRTTREAPIASPVVAPAPVLRDHIVTPPRRATHVGPALLAGLEVDALYALDKVGALQGEHVTVETSPRTGVLVEAWVDRAARKQAVAAALRDLSRNPFVRVQVSTWDEVAATKYRATTPSRTTQLRDLEFDKNRFALYESVHRIVASEEAVPPFAAERLNESRKLMADAFAIRHLAVRFKPDQLRTLNAGAFVTWESMIHDHARAMDDATARLQLALGPLLRDGGARSAPDSLPSSIELESASARVLERATAADELVRACFSVAPGQASIDSLDETVLVERLAAALAAVHSTVDQLLRSH